MSYYRKIQDVLVGAVIFEIIIEDVFADAVMTVDFIVGFIIVDVIIVGITTVDFIVGIVMERFSFQ